MEMTKRKTTNILQGTKSLGASLVANINPTFIHPSSPTAEAKPAIVEDQGRVYTLSDLANLSFHQVAREGNVNLLEKLLERIPTAQQKKKRLNAKDDDKLTPLHYAARCHHYNMIDFLIAKGANVQAKGEDDVTSLHFIAKYKKKKIEDAQDATADEDSSSDDESLLDQTPSCLRLLVEHGAQVNTKDAMGLTPLHYACTRGNISATRELLECTDLGLEITDNQGMTALHLGCLYGHKRIVQMLLEAGSNLRCRDRDMTTPLHLACIEGSIQIAQALLNKAATSETVDAEDLTNGEWSKTNAKEEKVYENSLDTRGVSKYMTSDNVGVARLLSDVDEDKNLPLHLAVENGHQELVKFYFKNQKEAGLGNTVNICRFGNDSCLHLAVQANSIDIVKFLINEGADVNARNSLQVTPLLLACQHNIHNIVKYLLENGANIEMKDLDLMTPLLVASRYGHLETISLLLDHNADITETDKDDRTCLMWATEENRMDALKLLLRKKRKILLMIEEREKHSNTALHLASIKGHADAVKLLLDHRASAVTKNNDDRTTLHMAALHGHDSIIPVLVNRDRSIINGGDEESNSALHLAAIGGNLKCVSVLIQSGANIELRNARQWTPLDCAAAYGWVKVAKCLLDAGASVQPRGKIKICALHLACQRGHIGIVQLLLQWKADVTFRGSDGRNALDFAIDFSQKECVLVLLKHETWSLSLKNSVINPVTGRMTTPMRKLISKMEDMAQIVCNQCVVDNEKKPENDDYAITLNYEFFDDMYVSTEWTGKTEARSESGSTLKRNDSCHTLMMEDTAYTVYDENGELTAEAQTYSNHSLELQENHPLNIMVDSKCESLLIHPVVTGLLNYKWKKYGRYVYYGSLLIYVAYLLLLNIYMLILPSFYQIDWVKLVQFRRYVKAMENNTGLNISNDSVSLFANQSLSCWFYRHEVIISLRRDNLRGCQIVSPMAKSLRLGVFVFSVINLLRECLQITNQRINYVNFTNMIEFSLYLLSLLLTLDFASYNLKNVQHLTANALSAEDIAVPLYNLQADTGLQQEWQQELGAFAVFMSWIVLLLFIQKLPRLGIFVVMFTDILKTFGEFFVVFIFFIFAFAFSFTQLLGNQHVFEHWYESLVTITVMTIGEIDYAGRFFRAAGLPLGENYHFEVYTEEVSYVLFFILLMVMTIIIMNLLVGLAVGDIIEVQEHATLERLGMQVALALEVEFNIPAFLRKKLSIRKQRLEVNKYRKANFIKKFLFEDANMSIEHIVKALDKEAAEKEEPRSESERIIYGLSILRSRISDLADDQADVKRNVRSVKSLVREVQNESRINTEDIKENVSSTSTSISRQINSTHTGLTQTTHLESGQTRSEVDGTKSLLAKLQNDMENTQQRVNEVKYKLEERMNMMQEVILLRNREELQSGVQRCLEMVEKSRNDVMESLEKMKVSSALEEDIAAL